MTRRGILVVALVAALVPACSRPGGDDGAFRLELDGRATIVGPDGEREVDTGGHRLEAGDAVRVLDGDAVLELPGTPEVLLREKSEVVAATAPEIVDGDAVVIGDVRFTAGDVEVALERGVVDAEDAAVRVQRGLGVTVAVYRGRAEIRSAGRSFDGGLAALRQLTVPATGLLPREPVPLVYDAAAPDPWDRRFLGDAIPLGRELDILSRGFTAQLGPRARADASLLRRVLPPLAEEAQFDTITVEPELSPGESLVGAAIVVESDPGDLPSRWAEVFGFREDGAHWGLVALDQAVRRDALRGRIDDAIDRSPLLFAAGRPPEAVTAPTTPTTAPPGSGPTSTTTTEPDEPGGPTPTLPPLLPPGDPDDPEEPPPDDPGGLIEELIEDLLP